MRNRTATASNIQSIVNTTREKSVSRSTVRRRLVEHGLNGRVAVSKPLLRARNKRKRLLWAQKYRCYTKKDWENVLFADESKFEIYGNKRRIYVRHRKNEKFESSCIKPTVKHGGGNIQVWGCFSFNGVGDLYKIKKTLEKKQYHSILLGIEYIARPLRHFQWDLVSKHLYDLVFLSMACLVTCMHIILFRHNLNFHFYYQARYTLSEFIVSPPLLVLFSIILYCRTLDLFPCIFVL